MISLTSWVVDVIRRATPRPVGALSALMIAVVLHTLWRKRTRASNTRNSELENAPCPETTAEAPSSNTRDPRFEGLDQGHENQNKETVQLDPETTKSQDSSAVVVSEKVFKTPEVSNGFETSSRKSSRTEVSINVDDALPGKLEVEIPTSCPNGIDTDNNFKPEKAYCAEATVKEDGYLDSFPNKEILNGIINNSVKTVDSNKNFASHCDSSHGDADNTCTRLIATLSMLNEDDTKEGLVKSSKSLIERRDPDEESNLPTGCRGISGVLESASVGIRDVAEIWEDIFKRTEKVIKETEASIQRCRIKLLDIVDEDYNEDFDGSPERFLDARKSTVESLSSKSNDARFEAQNLGYRLVEISEKLAPEKREVVLNGDNSSNALKLSENLRSERCQKDQVLNNDCVNILDCMQRESYGRKVESSKLKLIEDLKLDGNNDNQSMSNFNNTDFFADLDACDMLLSLTQNLHLSHVVLNGFTLYDSFATLSYYTKLLISNLMPGNSAGKAIPNNNSNLGSENNLDKDEKVSDSDILGKLMDICKTNTNFKNFVLRQFLKEGLILSYHIPENDTRQGNLTAGYREPEYQYLLDGTCDSGEKQSLLESNFEESNETTEDGGCYTVSSYTLPEKVEGNSSISSLDGELEVRIEHEDFEVKTYRVISADFLRYETGSPLDFRESKDPFGPSFPFCSFSTFGEGRDDSLKFEDSFTVNLLRDGNETNRCIESNKLKADVGESSENVFLKPQGNLKNDSGELLQIADLEDSLGLKRKEGSRSFHTEEIDLETGEKMNCVVLLQVDPEERPVNTREPNVKGDGFEQREDRDDDDDDDDDDDEKKVDEQDEDSSEWRKCEDRGSEKNGESSENPGDGQNGGGTGSGGGGDEKKNGDSKGRNVKDESSEDEGKSDTDDEDDDKKNEKAEVSSEKDESIDDEKYGSKDTEKNISKDPKMNEILLVVTSLNVDDLSKKLRRDAIYSYKIKHKVRTSRKRNTPLKLESPKKRKVEGEEKDKEGDDEQTNEGTPSGGKEHGEKDRKMMGGESSGAIGGAADGSGGGGSGSSGGGGGDDKKKDDDFVRKKVEEDEEKSSSEEDKNESEDRPRPSNKDFSESEPNEGDSGGSTVPASLQATVGEVRPQASRRRRRFPTATNRRFGKIVHPSPPSREEGIGEGVCTTCKRLKDGFPKSFLDTLDSPVSERDKRLPEILEDVFKKKLEDEECQGENNTGGDQQSCDSKISKEGKTAAKGGEGSRKIKSPKGPMEAKKPKSSKDATVSAAKGSKSPKASPKKVAIKSSQSGGEESTEPKKAKNLEELVTKLYFYTKTRDQEQKKAREIKTVTIKREPAKPKKQKSPKKRPAAPEPKKEEPKQVGETSHTTTSVDILTKQGCSHWKEETAQYYERLEETDKYNKGFETELDISLSDDDVEPSSNESTYPAPNSTVAPPHPDPPVDELPLDIRPEQEDEMQEQNPGPLDLSKRTDKKE